MFNYYFNTARFCFYFLKHFGISPHDQKTLAVPSSPHNKNITLFPKWSRSLLPLAIKYYSFSSRLSCSSPHDKKALLFPRHITFLNSCGVVLFSSQHFPQVVAFSSPHAKKNSISLSEFVSSFPLTIKT